MSQLVSYEINTGVVLTLTGDAGGAISPTAGGDITLTGGTGITTTGAGNTITINSTSLDWTEVVGVAQAMSVNNGYILNNAALITATLPAAVAVGEIIAVVGSGAGGWKIAQNAGQTIHFLALDSTAGVAGYLQSTNRYDCVELICITANTDFVVKSSVGNITVA